MAFDGATKPTSIEGNEHLEVNGVGAKRVVSSGLDNLGALQDLTVDTDGHLQVDVLTAPTVTVNSHAVTNAGTFVVQENGSALTALQVIDNMISGSEAQVDVVAALPAGTNVIGGVLPNKSPVSDDAVFMKKYYTNAGAVTDGIIWSPAAATRWYVTDLIINTSAAATITIEDDLAGGDSPVMKFELAANGGLCKRFATPLFSGEDAADLIITTSAGNVYVTVVGYEV